MSPLALRHVRISAVALTTAASMSLVMLAATPSEAAGAGTLDVVVKTPAGVAANAVLDGPTTQVFAKSEEGAKLVATRSAEPGEYQVHAPTITADGVVYEATRPKSVEVKPGKTTDLTVVYAPVGGATRMRATSVTDDSIDLRWAQPDGTSVALRRTPGSDVATDITDGTAVAVGDGTAADTGLQPGTGYTYSLFSRVGGAWVGPLAIRAKTSSPARHTAAVLPRSTVVLVKRDAGRLTPAGDDIRVTVPDGGRLPTIGSGVSIRPNDVLPGGYLGRVVSVAKDGSAYRVEAGGLADVVDYLDADLDIDHVGDIPLEPMPEPTPLGRTTFGQHQRSLLPSGAKRVVQGDCLDEAFTDQVTTTATIDPNGHFTTSVRSVANKPPTATYDVALSLDGDIAIDVDTTDDVQCTTQFQPVYVKLVARPVPVVLGIVPIVSVSADSGVVVTDFGVQADAGFELEGDFGKGDNIDGGLTLAGATPHEATVTKTGSVFTGMGGYVGLGALGSAFLQSSNPQLVALMAPTVLQGDTYFTQEGDVRRDSCLVADGSSSVTAYMVAAGYLGAAAGPDPGQPTLEQEAPYSLDPWYLPTGCEDTPDPIVALGGDGVDVDDLDTTGDGGQFGHLDGFAPGEDAWVLSTGLVADAVGEPSKQADTQLGLEGSDFLTTLSGFQTFDQATMTVNVTPTGDTLHVRYAFASEEYPEYVGSGVNDVMAVLVDGENCAYVPGTSTPVSIDTVNDHTNAEYYVDNAEGAAGYNTSMDGITTPLECEVAVTPDEPVEVSIMLADGGDGAYDSAVAMLDGGIWSD